MLSDNKVDEKTLWAIELAVSEAVTNAMKYGCPVNGSETVEVEFEIWSDRLEISIIDRGKGFDWERIVSPDFTSPKESGYGIYIIRELMDEISYTRSEKHNVLKLIKYLA